MLISEKFELIRKANNLTKMKFCDKVGMSRSHYDRLLAEKNSDKIINKTTNISIINSICYLFNVDKQWLTNDESNIDFFDKKFNQQIVDNYMLLSEASKNIVDNLIDGLLELNNNQPSTTQQPVIRLAVYDQPVCAGNGNFIADATKTFKDFPNAPSDADFVVRVQGDSMTPTYNDGDLVFIKSTDTLNNGDDGIFIVDGDITLKRFMGNELIPLNPKYSKISQKAIIQGKVVGIAEHHSDLEAEVLDIVNQDKPQNLKKSI